MELDKPVDEIATTRRLIELGYMFILGRPLRATRPSTLTWRREPSQSCGAPS